MERTLKGEGEYRPRNVVEVGCLEVCHILAEASSILCKISEACKDAEVLQRSVLLDTATVVLDFS
jgi:hypothetical protein